MAIDHRWDRGTREHVGLVDRASSKPGHFIHGMLLGSKSFSFKRKPICHDPRKNMFAAGGHGATLRQSAAGTSNSVLPSSRLKQDLC